MRPWLIVTITFITGCASSAPYPKGVCGYLVDEQLDVFDIRKEQMHSLRPFVERQLASNNLPKASRYAIAPNGKYVACLETNKINVVDLSTGQCLRTISAPRECIDIGALSWKPDSSGFIFYAEEYKPTGGDPGNPLGKGYIAIAEAPVFECHAISGIGQISNRRGAYSLATQAWCSNARFVFGDDDAVKTYDVASETVQVLCKGYDPIGASQNSYVFQKRLNGCAALGNASFLMKLDREKLQPQPMRNATLNLAIERPVISPDGNYFIFVNRSFGTSLLGLAGGFDYSLVIYDQTHNMYTRIKNLEPCAGFYFFNLDFTNPADGPLIKLVANAVWVQPLDMDGWETRLSKKTR